MTNHRMQAAKDRVKELIEKTAEQFVMDDLSDAAVLENLSGAFVSMAEDLDGFFPLCARAAWAAGGILHQAAANGGRLLEKEMRSVEKTISAIQSLVGKDVDEKELDLPEELVADAGLDADRDRREAQAGPAAPAADPEILEEYLAQQEAVIPEMEELVLSFEQHPDPGVLKELKRLLHTAKGEAGVIGLSRIERVCHQVEDYIEREGENPEADLLLEFKDWFEQAVVALRNHTDMPPEQNLLQLLQAGREAAKEDGSAAGTGRQGPCPETARPAPPAETDGERDALLCPVAIEDPEITADFISEANEHFEISDENLLTLENDPGNEEAIASIFRAFHTIKGTTSFLGLSPISVLAHKAENLLDEVRKKRLAFSGEVVDATFNALDLLKKMNTHLEAALAAGEMFVPPPELPEVFAHLQKALNGDPGVGGLRAEDHFSGASGAQEDVENEQAAAPPPETVPSEPGDGNGAALIGGAFAASAARAMRQTMKIDADRIDLLLETIGELVIVESIVSQEAGFRENGSRNLERNLGQLKKITRSLQDIGMSMRLIPIDNTFRKMGRLVRDLSKKSGKKIELVMEGRETELDKAMVEKLGDPLVHMIRNAVDHGIEATAEDRRAAGKDPTGTILLKAYHQGGNIHIDIADDGRGLDRDAIFAKAVERGIVNGDENMSDEEIYALIFEPGFSTARQVTDVSGRGVGMDVVKSNIESMRGNVRIASEKGRGTTFTLVLPLTMAIIDGMIVRVGSERYILPLLSIIESFQPTREMITTVSGKGETVPFRNRLLPLFRLGRLFNIADAQADPTRALVVVLEDAGRQIALLVDELMGQNQTVIKNLGEGLKDVEGIAGASIMPDGRPGLIIDVNGLVRLATA